MKDCYDAVGATHSQWKPLPGGLKDFVAMPKFNMCQSLHTTVIGPDGQPLEIQIRTGKMHNVAEYGVAAQWIYKVDSTKTGKGGQTGADARAKPLSDGELRLLWLRSMADWQGEQDPEEFMESLEVDLFDEEVFVFTPKDGAEPLRHRGGDSQALKATVNRQRNIEGVFDAYRVTRGAG